MILVIFFIILAELPQSLTELRFSIDRQLQEMSAKIISRVTKIFIIW